MIKTSDKTQLKFFRVVFGKLNEPSLRVSRILFQSPANTVRVKLRLNNNREVIFFHTVVTKIVLIVI